MIQTSDDKTRATVMSLAGIKPEGIPPVYKGYSEYLAGKGLKKEAADATYEAFFAMHLLLWNDDQCPEGAAFLKAREGTRRRGQRD